MSKLREIKHKTPSGVFKRAVVEELDTTPKTDRKSKSRLQIEQEVFDIQDSVADNAKWSSLLTSFIIRIYNVLPEEVKDSLDPADRAIIENLSAEFDKTPTRLDIQLEKEGFAVVDRMLQRQRRVAEIVKTS